MSVLFADLVGFTTLSEHRDAEDVRELLSRYFEAARQIVERHGGLVEKFIGDAVMAVWGTPTAHEDDAERAVRAALELVAGVGALGRESGVVLEARAGVMTGQAAVTVGAVSQGIVTGDLVNTASRLQTAAEPGTVLVGEETYRAAAQAIVFAVVGPLTLKGKEGAVSAWRAVRVVGRRGGIGRAEGLEPPFVGRTEELRLIKELLHATGRERKARLVSVMGIAGIGKSRLAWEFLKYVDGLAEDVYWHQGRCPAYGDGVTFWALGEMVRMRAGIAESDDPAESRRKLSAAVEEYLADDEERRWIEPRLAHLLGLEERPAGEREELFSAWRTFFERIAERGTTLLVFEDLQWADPGLLDFVGSMLEWSRNHPILIVTLSRPEIADRRPNWGVDQRSFTSLHLEPLPDEAMAEMVRGYVRGLPPDGVARIVARAEGVPLYAVETVRMLADRGVVEPRGVAYELVGDLGDLDIPETLQALIAARLDALASQDRSLLQDASVLGKSFTVEALAAISGQEPGALEPRLRELGRKEFLVREADPRSPERGQHTFVQGLIREVAYSTLSKADRRRKHLATAHHLEALDDEELAGVVATHYVEAFRASPEGPDAEALAARARDWLAQAATRALSLGVPEQALGYAQQALEITPEGAERAALLEQAAEAARRMADERAVPYLDEAIGIHRQRGDVAAAARATARLHRPFAAARRTPEAIERMEGALADLGPDGDERARAELCTELADACTSTGESRRALEWAELALPLAESLDLPELLPHAIASKSEALFNLGRHHEAAMLARGNLALAEGSGSHLERAHAAMTLGVIVSEDDPAEALSLFLRAAEEAKKAGMRPIETMGLANAVEAAIDLGRWSDADAALADLEGRDLPQLPRTGVTLCTAMLAAFRGDLEGSLEHLEEAAATAQASDFVQMRAWHLRARSVIKQQQGDLAGAFEDAMAAVELDPAGVNSSMAVWVAGRSALWLTDVRKAERVLEAMKPLRGRWVETARRSVEAGLAALEGRTEEASAGYRRALEAWDAMESPLDLALTAIDAALLLPGDPVGREAATRAREILADLGAKPLLERLADAEPAMGSERQVQPAGP
ncbi:MAG TPA: adenylate/guanylate cyclase domain-containing protein [Actinomycetota bacterium]|nr:adenylate/guanylate cyclase domain-containing protein [Actinomycetota bacterium]